MKTKLFPVALASLSLVALAACGRGDDDDAAAAIATQPGGRCTCNDCRAGDDARLPPSRPSSPPRSASPTSAR